jgi:hypothetical protein
MRLLLAILALVGLLVSPLAAQAAAQRCAPSAGISMAMQGGPAASAGERHCCPDSGKPGPHHQKSCAQACAMMCAAVAALPASAPSPVAPQGRPLRAASLFGAVHAHPPSGLKRPPRSIA